RARPGAGVAGHLARPQESAGPAPGAAGALHHRLELRRRHVARRREAPPSSLASPRSRLRSDLHPAWAVVRPGLPRTGTEPALGVAGELAVRAGSRPALAASDAPPLRPGGEVGR